MNDSINSNNKENYDKYVVDSSNPLGDGRYENIDMNSSAKGKHFGQVKYAKRGGYESIYDDPTRDSDNDTEAKARMNEKVDYDSDESQDGMY